MKNLKILAAVIAAAFLPMAAGAQSPVTATKPAESRAATSDEMAVGEVQKVDKDGGRLTIKHGEIKSLDMPPMTMVFTAKDKAIVKNINAGQKIRFKAVNENGKYFVTEIHADK